MLLFHSSSIYEGSTISRVPASTPTRPRNTLGFGSGVILATDHAFLGIRDTPVLSCSSSLDCAQYIGIDSCRLSCFLSGTASRARAWPRQKTKGASHSRPDLNLA